MVYLFGVLGFIGGFMAGLLVINIFLRGISNTELVSNKSLRWTYGVAVWIFAGLGIYAGLWMHARYFPS